MLYLDASYASREDPPEQYVHRVQGVVGCFPETQKGCLPGSNSEPHHGSLSARSDEYYGRHEDIFPLGLLT